MVISINQEEDSMRFIFSKSAVSTPFAVLLSGVFFLLMSTEASGQRKFNENPGGFVEEMSVWLQEEFKKEKDLREEAIRIMTLYQAEWNYAFTLDQQMMVINTCNLMLKKKMQANPQFLEYLPLVLRMAQSGHSEQSFEAWNKALNNIADKKPRNFRDFLSFTDALITRNMIYESNIVKWKVSSEDAHFEFVDGKVMLVFRNTDLTCYAFNDSSVIYGTEGIYDPVDYRWSGTGGKVTWSRVGFGDDEVYATLGNYRLRTQFSKFDADTVFFYHGKLFAGPQMGKLSENVQYFKDTLSASYPRFESYDKRYFMPDIFKGVDYAGGFAFHGSKFLGSGDLNNPASFSFRYKGNVAVRVTSPSFTIRPDRLSSSMARVVIYLDEDSIYHPGLEILFRNDTRQLSMYTVEVGTGQSRFFNTYHGVDMAAEELHWNMDEGKIKLKTEAGMSGASEAYFESRDYYSKRRFDDMRGIDAQNPLFPLRQYSQKVGRKDISLDEYARFLRMDPVQVMMQLITLANMGYIEYNIDKGEFVLRDKVANTLMAFAGLIDYDVIRFYSATTAGTPNAEIDLNNLNLEIYGLQDAIQLSDSQNVFIEPDHGRITMQQNRSFVFSGNMRIGLFRFKVNDAHFDYQNFTIDAPDIRSLTFYVNSFDPNDLDARGVRNKRLVQTELTDLSGKIAIDNPQNKSGVKHYPRYPIFTCTTDAYAYYDSKDIHRGTYVKDRFFYKIDPFELDSLASFSTEGFMLQGTLFSAGIFPNLTPPLRVRPDYSLGFVYETTASGLPTYNGKGTYYNTIDLSNQGFYGRGELTYITSRGTSENYLFTPDSTIAELKTYTVAERGGVVEYPELSTTDVNMRWFPYRDRMEVNHKDKYRRLKENPMSMFDQRAALHGNFILTPEGSSGNGAIVIKDAEIDSKEFMFGQRTIDAEHADFRLKATYADIEVGILPRDGYELMTNDYKANINFDKEVGSFTSNGGASRVHFLINQYLASIDMFEWHMNAETIRLQNTSSTGIEALEGLSMEELVDRQMVGSEFISTNPFQDSLRFFAIDALYDRRQNVITATGVKLIKVADAAIFPKNEKVTIYRKAEMDTLFDARLLTNLQTKYHRFYDVTARITGAKQYEAKGSYDYVDITGGKQKIPFHRIYADRSAHTTGEGKLAPEDNFSLSPYFDFYGDMVLRSSHPYLTFAGGARIKHLCDTMQREWLRFTADINPAEVMIPVSSKPVNLNYRDVGVGILVSKDTTDVYAAFFDQKHRAADKEIIDADGFLVYDEASSEYRVSNLTKLKDKSAPGNYISFNTSDCTVQGEGKLAIGDDLGMVKMDALGNANYEYASDSLSLELVLGIDFFFSEPALRVMIKDLESAGGLGVSLNTDAYQYALNYWVGSKKTDDLSGEISLYGAMRRIPEEMQKTIIFADIQLQYNTTTRSFIYQGPIGIGNIRDKQINRYVDGMIEISRERSGDIFTILLEVSDNNWYLFDYSRGRMMALSGNEAFNKAIRDTKPDKRKLQDEKTREMYLYTLSTPRKKKSFERRFEALEEDGF
ncbi:MAG: hypothetical protein R6V49_04100 [Bacteroidales bacterium]